jgi:predicted aldo/keto reductase-like oxidoreductase
MEKFRLGRTEMMVTRLGFGGIPVVKKCLESGINFLDTANGYTTSEERIGKAIAGRRDDVFIATKSLARTRDEVTSHIKLSLERLGVEYVDLYQLHNVSDARTMETVLDPAGPMAAVVEAKRAGKVKHIGVSSHQIDIAKDLVKSGRFETIMFPFNFMSYEGNEELLALVKAHDMGFIAMKPLAGGMIPDARIAIKYLMQFPDILIIPGIERVAEIEEIARTMAGPAQMTAAEKDKMEQMRLELGARFCRRCDYCQPCQMEIPISDVMSFPNLAKRLPAVRLYTGKFATSFEKALNCTECGECEERCPYHLPIRDMLALHVKMHQEGKLQYEKQIAS